MIAALLTLWQGLQSKVIQLGLIGGAVAIVFLKIVTTLTAHGASQERLRALEQNMKETHNEKVADARIRAMSNDDVARRLRERWSKQP